MISKTTSNSMAQAWLALFMGGLFYCYQFVIRVSPDVMADDLMQAFRLDSEGLSLILMWYYAGYAGMQVPLGLLMDRFGARRIIAMGAALCAVATYVFSIADSNSMAGFARFLIGLGSACGYLGALKLGSKWFPRDKMPMVVAVVMTMGTLGASFGLLPLTVLVDSVGWKGSLEMVALGGLLLAVAIYFLVGKNPPYKVTQPKDQHLLEDLFQIVLKPQAWLIALFAMLMYLPLTLIGDMWGVSFLKSKYDIPEAYATVPVTCMFVGVALGSPVFAWMTHTMKSRIKPMAIGALITSILWLTIVFVPPVHFFILCALMFLGGFLFNGQTLAFTAICEIMPLHASGVSVGFVNMIVMLNGFVFLPIVGKIMVALWDGTIVNDVPMYATSDYQWALSIIPFGLILAWIFAKLIRETYHVHQEK